MDGEPATVSHLPDLDHRVGPSLRRFVVGVGIARLAVPIISFFTIVAPLVSSIGRGNTTNIYWLLLIRPSKDIQLWGGGLYRTTGEVDLLLLFLAWAPLMIVMNWAFFFIGRAYGPRIAAGNGPRWLTRMVSPENFALARTLLGRRGATIAVLGRVAALPPTVLAAAAGTSDISAWRYQLADTFGAVVSFATTVGVGWLLGDAYERAGIWVTAGGVVLFFAMISWMTNWLQREAEVTEDDGDAVDGTGLAPDPA